MFERFTQDARAVVVAAQQQSQKRGDAEITRLHLLLALASAGPVSPLLVELGLDVEQVERSARGLSTTRTSRTTSRVGVSPGPGALDGTGAAANIDHSPTVPRRPSNCPYGRRSACTTIGSAVPISRSPCCVTLGARSLPRWATWTCSRCGVTSRCGVAAARNTREQRNGRPRRGRPCSRQSVVLSRRRDAVGRTHR